MKSTAAVAAVAALVLAAASPALAGPSASQAAPAACPVTAQHVTANGGLGRSRAAVADGRLTILAMGSSSIEGVGASRRELGFVPLLEAGLERRLPGVEVTVINKGIGGETAKETADRLAREITAGRPDLVIWQLGTNDVLRDRPMDDFFADFRRGETLLDRAGVDVLLVDPQRLPEGTTNPSFRGRNPALGETARLIDLEGGRVGYAVLHRFAAMADWGGLERGGVGPDDLHLNDPGYACWAEVTAEGLAAALR
ncbi:SGNH/GDSL hydrolase family protein [Roseibacterium beibuensis]|uniref:SGNH/GDSL hydrolase family protein n=1 Tax=[Roseibacterium] beibuensis TaxID=1193142 RepID=UPI00217E7F10|nr:SGNH/GDSL hydrolase family protein [Roseibacterium beibuensis]MCS6625699.1 SGNH/GDSL hydrolase family protein [Roseibacterium beibuensis]